jgi:phage N-6-adenine-methyltransferase
MSSTMNLGVHRITADPTWRTPAKVFADLDEEFNFTLDVCASDPIKPGIDYLTATDNALWLPWPNGARVFINPPYGRAIVDWMRKVTLERDRCEVIVGLLPARTDTEWWHEHVMPANEVRFIRGRLSFEGVDAPKGHNAPFPSVIVVWR